MQNPEKISLKFQLDQDIRRITVGNPITFVELQKQIRALFRFEAEKFFTVKYCDDEGDLCCISSDEELLEAVRVSKPTLRLQITVIEQPKPARSCPVWPRASCHGPRRGCGQFGQKIRNSTDLSNQAIEKMETDVNQAKALFFQQLEICPPWHTANCLYNIACCESILGNIDSALVYLSRSIDAGYRDSKHMSQDADFNNIKNTDGFKELLASISEPPQAVPEPTVPTFAGPQQLYNLACYHSLMGNLEPALNSLEKAVEAGFFRLNQLVNNPDLLPLHNLPIWTQFVEQVQENRQKWTTPQQQPQPAAPAPAPVQPEQQPKVEIPDRVPVQPKFVPLTQIRKVEEPKVIPLTQIRKVEQPQQPQPVELKSVPLTKVRKVEAPVAPASPAPVVPVEQKPQEPQISHPDVSQTSLDVLYEMGFLDRPRNLAALLVCGGDIEQAIARLLS